MGFRNHVGVTLTTEQAAGVTTALAGLAEATPFVVSLTPTERKRLLRLGPQSLAFANAAKAAAAVRPDLIPAVYDAAEMTRDLDLHAKLLAWHTEVSAIAQQLKDTLDSVGGDIMSQAMIIYRALRAADALDGLDESYSAMKQRWDRPGRPPEEPPVTT